MLKPCMICYRLTNIGSSDVDSKDGTFSSSQSQHSLFQFFKMSQRYLNLTSNEGTGDEKHQTINFERINKVGVYYSCGDCSKTMDSFCELYHEMKSIELLLNWKLWTLKNIMLCAQRVSSRLEHFRKYADQLTKVVGSDEIIKFRKELVTKCSWKLDTTFPKLTIKKYNYPTPGINETEAAPVTHSSSVGEINYEDELNLNNSSTEDRDCDEDHSFDHEQDGNHFRTTVATSSTLESTDLIRLSRGITLGLRNVHPCAKCGKTFSTQTRLDEHTQNDLHINWNPTQNQDVSGPEMDIADSNHPTPTTITIPLQTNHSHDQDKQREQWSFNQDTGKFACRLCAKEFEIKSSVLLHYQTVHLNLRYKCSRCSKVCTQKGNLKTHMKKYHPECWTSANNRLVVKKMFPDGTAETQPIEKPQKARRPPAEPDEYRKKNWKLRSTLNSETGRRSCNLCSKTFGSFQSFQYHYQSFHLKIRFKCKNCSKHFSTRQYLEVHERTSCSTKTDDDMTTGSPYPDSDTDSLSVDQQVQLHNLGTNKLVQSKARSTFNPETGRHACSLCPKDFKSVWTFRRHYRIIHLKIVKKCSQCKRKFQSSQELRVHLQKVHFGRKFKCSSCLKSFFSSVKRDRHTRTYCSKKKNNEKHPNADSTPVVQHIQMLKVEAISGEAECARAEPEMQELDYDPVPSLTDLVLGNEGAMSTSLQKFILPDSAELEPVAWPNPSHFDASKVKVKAERIQGRSLSSADENDSFDVANNDDADEGEENCGVSVTSKLKEKEKQATQASVENVSRVKSDSTKPGGGSRHKFSEMQMVPKRFKHVIRFRCKFCRKVFTGKDNYKLHQRNHCQKKKSASKATVPSQPNLNLATTTAKLTTCRFCGKRFPGPHSFQRHLKTAHLKSAEEKLVCDLCSEQFTSRSDLSQHQRSVHVGDLMKLAASDLGLRRK